MRYISKSIEETEQISAQLAEQIVSRKGNETPRQARDIATIVTLEGELGAGKTTFVKAFAKALGIKEKLTSPTFVLMRQYSIESRIKDQGFNKLIHVDAYRINSGKDLKALGIDEILSDPENIVLIEWAERVRDILKDGLIRIHIDHVDENTRNILIS